MPVTRLLAEGSAITGLTTAQGAVIADTVILATGTGTAALLAPLGVALPMLQRPGLLLRTRPAPPMIRHLLIGPQIEVRQDAEGRLLAPTAGGHQGDATEAVTTLPAASAHDALVHLRHHLPQAPDWAEVRLAHRPVPGDGLPLIGPVPGHPGLFMAVMHSGVTLAAVTAEMLAAEVAEQDTYPALAPFRPARLLQPLRID